MEVRVLSSAPAFAQRSRRSQLRLAGIPRRSLGSQLRLGGPFAGRSFRSIALSLTFLAVSNGLRAQTLDPHAAQPERPSVSTHAYTIAPGWLEIEGGSDRDANRIGVPVTAKIGVARRLQLSLSTAFARPSHEAASIDDVSIGLKWRLADELPLVGAIAVLPSVSMPTDTAGTVAASVVAISSKQIGPVGLDVNVGFTRRTTDAMDAPKSETVWAAAAGGRVRGNAGWVAEVFGHPAISGLARRSSIVATLVGATYTARPWLAFDGGVIVPVSGPQLRVVFAGLVWNAGRIWRPGR